MAQGKGGVPGGPPTQVNKLDNMLGSLQSDLNKLGVQTVAKGVCGACCKPIVGQVRRRCEDVCNISDQCEQSRVCTLNAHLCLRRW